MTPVSVHGDHPAGRIGLSYPQSLSDILRETPTAGVDEENTGIDSAIDLRPVSRRQRDGGWEQPAKVKQKASVEMQINQTKFWSFATNYIYNILKIPY